MAGSASMIEENNPGASIAARALYVVSPLFDLITLDC